jgi:hypothetical protein
VGDASALTARKRTLCENLGCGDQGCRVLQTWQTENVMNTQTTRFMAAWLVAGIATTATAGEPASAPKAEFHAFANASKVPGAKSRGPGVMPAPVEFRIKAYVDPLGQTHLQCEPHENPEHVEYVRRRGEQER